MPRVGVTDYLGPYNTFVGSFDSLISSFVYTQLLTNNHRHHQQERLQNQKRGNHRFVMVAATATLPQQNVATSYAHRWAVKVKSRRVVGSRQENGVASGGSAG